MSNPDKPGATTEARPFAASILPAGTPCVLRLPQVEVMTALKKTALYEMMKVGDFPRPIPIGSRARGWLVHEVAAWIEARAASRA